MTPARRKLKELSPAQVDNLFRSFFDSADGELVIEAIKEKAYCYATTAYSTSENSPNLQLDMNVREGMRVLALLIEDLASKPYQPEEIPT